MIQLNRVTISTSMTVINANAIAATGKTHCVLRVPGKFSSDVHCVFLYKIVESAKSGTPKEERKKIIAEETANPHLRRKLTFNLST